MTINHPMPTFVVGWNVPGYLPDDVDDLATFATFDDAKRYLIGELLRAADDSYYDHKADDYAAMAEDVNLWTSSNWIETTEHDCLPVRFWIEQVAS